MDKLCDSLDVRENTGRSVGMGDGDRLVGLFPQSGFDEGEGRAGADGCFELRW